MDERASWACSAWLDLLDIKCPERESYGCILWMDYERLWGLGIEVFGIMSVYSRLLPVYLGHGAWGMFGCLSMGLISTVRVGFSAWFGVYHQTC